MGERRRGGRVDPGSRRVRQPAFPRVSRQTPLQRHFLRRLERLVLLSRYGETHDVFSPGETALMKKATYSVFRDCTEMGLLTEARVILAAGQN